MRERDNMNLYEEIYNYVKAARLSKPVDTKALEDLKLNYGDILYNEALDAIEKKYNLKKSTTHN